MEHFTGGTRRQVPRKYLNYPVLMAMGGCRYPFVFIDGITRFSNSKRPEIYAFKNVSGNEPYFVGHFPEMPIMPGVLIAEGFGQLSGYLHSFLKLCEILEEEKGLLIQDEKVLFPEIATKAGTERLKQIRTKQLFGVLASQNLKFRSPVFPGDRIEYKSQLVLQDSGFCHHLVEAVVNGNVVASGTIVNCFFPLENIPW